jgi:hypothetical protein
MGSRESNVIWSKMMNYAPESKNVSLKRLENGETRYFYLPLDGTWLDGFDIDMSTLKGDLEFRFYPTGNIYANADATLGSAGNSQIDLQSIRLIAASELYSVRGAKIMRAASAMQATQRNFADFQHYYITQTVNAGEELSIDLDQFHHQSGMLLLTFRESKAYDAVLNFASLGPKATFDHVNVHGSSMLANGTPIGEEYMRNKVCPALFGNSWVTKNPVYVIPFSKDLRSAFAGVMNGFHTFRGDRERLRIIPDAKGTNMTRSYAAATLTVTGGILIGYKGCWTEPIAADAATAVVVAAAINELDSVKADGFKVSLDDQLIAPHVYTYTTLGGAPWVDHNIPKFEFQGALATPVDTFPIYLSFTAGLAGFKSSGSQSYLIDIYSLAFKNIQNARGSLRSQYI